MTAHSPELRPPAPTHHQQYDLLPYFIHGDAPDRVRRASQLLADGRVQIRKLHGEGNGGISTARLLTEVSNRLVAGIWEELVEQEKAPPGICLVALGSFGRRELSPQSDLDLLLVHPNSVKESQVGALARALPHLLWDLKLTLGFSVRSLTECARVADADHTVRTALMDARLVAGPQDGFDRFAREVLQKLSGRKVEAFIQAKVAELKARRERFGDSVFVLEPNLKLGEGGLRDLETALWVAEARYKAHGLTGLLQNSILPPREVERLRWARDFLLRSRHELHFSSGSKEDRLTFERQERVAEFFGYGAQPDRLPVEQFMRDYYLAASAIRQAADAMIARAEETLAPTRRVAFERRVERFRVVRGKLTLGDDSESLLSAPERSLEILRVADEAQLPLASFTRDQIAQSVASLEAARGSPQVVAAFKTLLTRPGTRGQFLGPMHELGLLGAVLPEFGRITAFHQHDLYHVYTVNIHSLFALRRLYALRVGDLLQEQPEFTREMQGVEDPLPLYLGMLFHDAGKGLGGRHSEKGRDLMAQVGDRLGLTARQREIAEFLVLHHLAMSHTAQRRDLSDANLVADFARTVGDLERLTCLYLLTYADVASVGPQMWNDWKARLLRELYLKARAALMGKGQAPVEEAGGPAVAFQQVWRRLVGDEKAAGLTAALPPRYYTSIDVGRAFLHARMIDRARRHPMVGYLRRRPGADFSEVTLLARNRPGVLALFAGILSAHRIDILRARIVSTHDGIALDVFDVRGPGGLPLERSKWRAARRDVLRVIRGETTVEEVLKKRSGTSLLKKHLPRVKTRVLVDNGASQDFTVVDVQAEDRVGLLYSIASVLHRMQAEIALAQVSTEANRANDSFYVTRGEKKILEAEQVEGLARGIDEALATLP